MTFNPISEPVDTILLANRESPGIAVISNASSPRMWDERRGYALSGARVVFRGKGLARPIVTLRLFTDEDFAAWHDWRTILDTPSLSLAPGTSFISTFRRGRLALDIWHPILEDLGITKVVIEDVLQLKQVADGEWNVDIKFIEFRRPVRRLITAEASSERPTDPGDITIGGLVEIVDNNGVGNATGALAPLGDL